MNTGIFEGAANRAFYIAEISKNSIYGGIHGTNLPAVWEPEQR